MEVSDGNRINLTFTSFEVEFDPFGDCGFDYVEVSYGNFSKKYCGLSVPGPFISNTTITVKFNSDDFYNETGFRAMWAVVQEGKKVEANKEKVHNTGYIVTREVSW